MSKRYVATITPLEPYTFGTERGSKYKGVRETGKESYIIESSLMPEQTTLLGTLRYIVLANKGLLRSNFNYDGNVKSKIDHAIGSESFSFEHPDRKFGVIKSISPVYIVAKSTCSEDKKTYIPNPFCNKRGLQLSDKECVLLKEINKIGFVPIEMSDKGIVTTRREEMRFPNDKEYDAKQGHGTGFIELSTRDIKDIKMENELFVKNIITGNRTDNKNDNKEGFFKREVVSFNAESEKADKVKYSFAVEIETDREEEIFPKQTIAYMGRKKSAFVFEFEETDEKDAIEVRTKKAFEKGDNRWFYALSDLYVEEYNVNQFAIVEKKRIRNLETHLDGNDYVNKRKKSQSQITLIKAGSVFFKEKLLKEKLPAIDARYSVAGYNKIIEIGGEKMNTIILLDCLTNLHVGNGEANYNIIDDEVERDPVTGYPTINSSGVKGALRAFILKQEKYKANCNDWFGAEGQESKKSEGKLKILTANMLAMPARATQGVAAYYLVSTEEMRKTYIKIKNCLGMKINDVPENDTSSEWTKEEKSNKSAEDIPLTKSYEFNGKRIYEISEEEFREISLPVMARNKLNDKGISENLWYEEVVAHESIFYVPVLSDDSLDIFKEAVNGKVIQFGGNASIGCGLCEVTVKEGMSCEQKNG